MAAQPNYQRMENPPPLLKHTLQQEQTSVLSLAAHGSYIFSGSQGRDIYVWNRRTLKPHSTLKGHTGSVLALEVSREKDWLFSSSGDSSVRIWCTNSLEPLYKIHPYLESDAGDLFCLAYCASLETLYVGCQNASLQWIDLSEKSIHFKPPPSPDLAPKRFHKFFDSFPQSERRPPGENSPNYSGTPGLNIETTQILRVPAMHVVSYAHYGYVYCMAIHPSPLEPTTQDAVEEGTVLITGSGDESVKIWACSENGLNPLGTLEGSDGAILSIVARDGIIFAGCQGGRVKVWDVDTRTLVRNILAQEGSDILSLSMMGRVLYSCASNGYIQAWSNSFDCITEWQGHKGIVLSSIVAYYLVEPMTYVLATGANDGNIMLWEITRGMSSAAGALDVDISTRALDRDKENALFRALADFVAIRSVSNIATCREHCRQAAIWLKKHLSQIGAHSVVLPGEEESNPVVLAFFQGKATPRKRRIMFYGHYDVMPAPSNGWASPPFELSGRNGYLYGRGVTDNKGPILAFAHAASALLSQHTLALDIVFLIEGEEEASSKGFAATVRKHKDRIGHIDAIIISNSYWIGEDTPCITYGLRGVVQASVQVSSDNPDLHSGMEGGATPEAMNDMIKLLSTLTTGTRVLIPGFCKFLFEEGPAEDCSDIEITVPDDKVRKITEAERELYALLAQVTGRTPSSLASKWREPSLTIHSVEVSGPRNATVIPSTVKAQLSLRIVPDQSVQETASSLVEYIETSFQALQSQHRLEVAINRTADWWLGDLDGPWFRALEEAVMEVWGERPLRIREGGSIPSIPLLEKEFKCQALHLPMGQSSDQAHLHNERMSLSNLLRGKAVAEKFFLAIASWKDI